MLLLPFHTNIFSQVNNLILFFVQRWQPISYLLVSLGSTLNRRTILHSVLTRTPSTSSAMAVEDKSKGKEESSGNNEGKTYLHPAYTVTNIDKKIKTLGGKTDGVPYSSWVKLFHIQATAYKVLDHIDGFDPPDESDPGYGQWVEIDALVLQWILNTISDELLARVLDANTTAYTVWNKLQSIFLNNKTSRAASLDSKFTGLQLVSCTSLEAYCQELRDLANQLGDVGQPVT
ncbi:hypothetical protein L1987_04201 [Smallanthus sonchifolius]|uniref:Uncharacterized protein n=1 Tax=Smallanthus sonchifolius TaxID=185202 RepID=A0ACB9KCW8_9ASTR|nr:hypothetical protein L1987_04201 [Smallanthus sonchifolius]